jgi:uncharacterized peroxidase-related enzyme
MPEDIRNRILAVQDSRDLSQTSFSCSPTGRTSSGPFFAYHAALMERSGNLTKAEREMIVVATSSSNQCQYCVVAHEAIVEAMGLQHIEIRFAHGLGRGLLRAVEPHGERNCHAPKR